MSNYRIKFQKKIVVIVKAKSLDEVFKAAENAKCEIDSEWDPSNWEILSIESTNENNNQCINSNGKIVHIDDCDN